MRYLKVKWFVEFSVWMTLKSWYNKKAEGVCLCVFCESKATQNAAHNSLYRGVAPSWRVVLVSDYTFVILYTLICILSYSYLLVSFTSYLPHYTLLLLVHTTVLPWSDVVATIQGQCLIERIHSERCSCAWISVFSFIAPPVLSGIISPTEDALPSGKFNSTERISK